MLKNRAAILGLLLMLGIAVFAAWQEFSSRAVQYQSILNPADPNAGHEQVDENKLGTAWSRIADVATRFWRWTTAEPVALYTAVLSFFSGVLVVVSFVQIRYLIRADKTARISAIAANLSARAAIGLQLPIIRIQPTSLGHGEDPESENCYVHSVTVFNNGATKAFPKEIIYGWTVGEALPAKPSYRFSNRFPLNSILEPNGKNVMQNLTGLQLLKKGEWSKICGGNYLWFYCTIFYEDFMEERRGHGFCWLWTGGMGMGWRPDSSPPYNQKT